MWCIVKSDGEAGYEQVFGFYESKAEAEKDLLEDDGDYFYRAIEVQNKSLLS